MKRFFCVICQRVKRVRKYPKYMVSRDADQPENRHGQCNWHKYVSPVLSEKKAAVK